MPTTSDHRTAGSSDPIVRATLLAAAAGALSRALEISNGLLHPDPTLRRVSVLWLFISALLTIVAALVPLPSLPRRTAMLGFMGVILFVVISNFAQGGAHDPAIYMGRQEGQAYFPFAMRMSSHDLIDIYVDAVVYSPFVMRLAILAGLSGIVLAARGRLRHIAFACLLICFFLQGRWLIHSSPNPSIDVYIFQKDATRALAHGIDPYAITFRDIYNGNFYGPGISVNNVLQFGYPYFPLTLLMTMPGYFAADEPRYAQLLGMIASAGMFAYLAIGRGRAFNIPSHLRFPAVKQPLRPALFRGMPLSPGFGIGLENALPTCLLGFAAGVLLLSFSRSFFVLEQSWTEPLVIFVLATTLFCAVRFPRVMPYMLGLFLVSKQYMPAAAALVILLIPRQPGSTLKEFASALLILALKAAAAGAIVIVPFFLWNPGAFWKSAITLQLHQPYRPDSLSFLAWYGNYDPTWVGPAWLTFVVLLLLIGLCIWRCPRTPAGFAMAVTLCYFGFFSFSKQAFCNYYYFIFGAMCCAIATLGAEVASRRSN